ncbi:MAG: T9SS type A sorting domain-containing protein [Ignavibacterium sp.]|nr:T9SS type A sorting domain-containing protein [Ignavibacterium sp.]
MNKIKYNILLVFTFLSIIVYAFKVQYPTGIVGLTEKDGALGCICHNFEKTDSVFAWIEGPDSVVLGNTVEYKLYLTGGPAVQGGFNLATLFGKVFPIDSLTQRLEYVQGDTQLTQTQPLNFTGDTIFWRFVYTAPDSALVDTIYSVVNSVNGDGNPTDADQWNFGRKFSITIYDSPISVKDNFVEVKDFILYQNYPNPFNPSTKISWQSPISSHQTLKIYDLLGNFIATLVDDNREAGVYEIDFDATKFNLTSGVYLISLSAGNFSETKKIVLMK